MTYKEYNSFQECLKELKNFYICEVYSSDYLYTIKPVLNRIGMLSRYEVYKTSHNILKPVEIKIIKSKKNLERYIKGDGMQIKTVFFGQ